MSQKQPDKDSAFCEHCRVMSVEIQEGVLVGVQGQYDRYLEICGCSTLDSEKWLSKEDFLLSALCAGLGFKDMKFSDVINQAIVAGCIKSAEFLNEMEIKLGIIESE
jgi:hypothetical protein